MIKYLRNNITFRIASADAIGKFKSAQAHSFVQLARKELKFDEAAKETVLLEYDRLSQWIFRVERICLSSVEGKVSEDLQLAIIHSLEDEFSVIENVLESNIGVFSEISISFSKMIHRYSLLILRVYLIKFMDNNVTHAYTNIVSAISGYLQHLLVAMHEFNANIVNGDTPPFVCSTDFSIEYSDDSNRFISSTSRAQFFKDNGVGNTFILKDYSKHNVYKLAHEHFASLGFDIIPENETNIKDSF